MGWDLGVAILNYVVLTLLTHGLLDTPETYSNLKFEAQIHSDYDPTALRWNLHRPLHFLLKILGTYNNGTYFWLLVIFVPMLP